MGGQSKKRRAKSPAVVERSGPAIFKKSGNVANQAGHQTIQGNVYITQLVEDHQLYLWKQTNVNLFDCRHEQLPDQAVQQREMREEGKNKKCLKDLRLTDPPRR